MHGGKRFGAGRPRGSLNLISKNIRENIIEVFNKIGGIDEFANWAKKNEKNKTEFYKLYSRLASRNEGDFDYINEPQVINVTFKKKS